MLYIISYYYIYL